MTGKRRAQLRKYANGLETIFQIGKGGIDDELLSAVDGALTKRELIKLRVLESSMLTAREACGEICEKLGAEPIQTIGSRFVIYRQNPEIDAFAE